MIDVKLGCRRKIIVNGMKYKIWKQLQSPSDIQSGNLHAKPLLQLAVLRSPLVLVLNT